MEAAVAVEQTGELSNIITDDDFSGVPEPTVNKIKEYLNSLEFEKKQIEEQFNRASVELEDVTLQHQSGVDKIRALESSEQRLSKENATLKSSYADLQQAKNSLELQVTEAHNDKQALSSVLERKERELVETADEIAELRTRYDRLNAELLENQMKSSEVQSSVSVLQSKLNRKEAECSQLLEERNTLDAEKFSYMRQISQLQMNKSCEIAGYQHQLEITKNDLASAEELVETYKKQCESLAEKLRLEQNKQRDARDNFITAEESHRQELSAQRKLTKMYKEAEEKVNQELQDLYKTCEEYKVCFQNLQTEHQELMSTKQGEIAELQELLANRDEKIEKIDSELKKMNELVQESAEQPDLTAELARLIKSGLTYSQLYHKYHKTSEQLVLQKSENERLNDCLTTLIKEVDLFKPQVLQLKTAHEASSSMVEKLSDQLRENMKSLEEEARKSNEARRNLTYQQKEAKRYQYEAEDLAMQVQILTKELHIAKGGRVSDDDVSAHVTSSSQPGSADYVISTELVSFRDIQELQKQNQQLRSALRDMSSEQEQSEAAGPNQQLSAELQRELELNRTEIAQLKQSREKQEELVQSIIRQRDMYKRLVEQGAAQEAHAKASPRRSTTVVDDEKLKLLHRDVQAAKEAEEKLRQELNNLKKERLDYERDMQEKMDDLRKSLTEHKMSNAKLSTQLDYSVESSKTLEKNIQGYKQEISSLRSKAEQYSNLVAKNEALVTSLRSDLTKLQESNVKTEISNQQLRNELEILKTSYRRIQSEAETARHETGFQLQMLTNLQNIQRSVELTNSDMKTHYKHRLEQADNDQQVLKKQIESLKQQIQSIENLHSTEIADWKSRYDMTTQELTSAKSRLAKMTDELKALKQAAAGSHREGSTSQDEATGETAEESEDMKQLKSQLDSLQEQLRLTSEASDEYRQVADRLEQTLREQTTASHQLQETLESRCNQLQSELENQTARVEQLSFSYNEIFEQKSALETQLSQTQSQLTSQITELQSSLSSYKQKLESKEEMEAKARADLQQATLLQQELTEKYQAELDKSIKLNDQLYSAKKEVEKHTNRISDLENEVLKLELQQQTNHADYEEREKQLRETIKMNEQTVADVRQQNSLLHQQLECMSVRVSTESLMKSAHGTAATDSDESGSNQSTNNLLELIKSLRKEKELNETKLESATAESMRLQSKLKFLEGELERARNELAGERPQAEIDIQTKAQHAELLRKIEHINVLTDSNRLLRQERDSMQPRIDDLEQQLSKLKSDTVPLNSKITQLTEQVNSLESQKDSLAASTEHWKSRFSSLHGAQKTLSDEKEQIKKENSELNSQLDKLRAEMKSKESSLDVEKKQMNEKEKSLKEELEASKKTVESQKEDLLKKDNLILDLKKIGRKYKAQFQQLRDKTGGDNPAASPAPSSSAVSDEKVGKLESDLAEKTSELEKVNAELEDIKSKLEEVKSELKEKVSQLESANQEKTKVDASMTDLTSRHEKLREFVQNSLKPKLKSLTAEIDAKTAEANSLKLEIDSLKTKMNELESKLEASKHKTMDEKAASIQPSHSSTSDVKIGNVKPMSSATSTRTVEVRPMAQQHKQPTATVIPTTSVADQVQETVDSPAVNVVPPTTVTVSTSSSLTASTDTASPTAVVTAQPSTSHTEQQSVPSAVVTAQTSAYTSQDQPSQSEESSEAESRAKRTRDEFEMEGDQEEQDDEPDVKRTREAQQSSAESGAETLDEGTLDDTASQEAEYGEYEEEEEQEEEFEEEGEEEEAGPSSTVDTGRGGANVPVYSSREKGEIVIVSSSDEEDGVDQSHQQESADEEAGDIEEYVEDEDYAEEDQYGEYYDEQQMDEDGNDEGGEEDLVSGSDGESAGDDEGDEISGQEDNSEEEDLDNSDIIIIEDANSNPTGGVPMHVSSSQPNRNLAPLAVSYQGQPTISMESQGTDDDGIVPRTPTLSQPSQRNDGFAVALSSPGSSRDPFMYESCIEQSSEYGGLAQQATVLDELHNLGDADEAGENNEVDGGQPEDSRGEAPETLTVTTLTSAAGAGNNDIVSSSEANEAVQSEQTLNEGAHQSNIPTSSTGTRPQIARRGRGRGGRLNRPTFQ